jgi:hypothetical protein
VSESASAQSAHENATCYGFSSSCSLWETWTWNGSETWNGNGYDSCPENGSYFCPLSETLIENGFCNERS